MSVMSAAWPAIYSEPRNRRLPSMEQLYGPWLCRGENVSVYYARLEANYWPEHSHRQAEFLLTFDEAEVEITWQDGAGHSHEETVKAHQYCIIAPHVPHTCECKSQTDAVVVYIEEDLLKAHLTSPLSAVIVDDFHPLSRLDACLRSLGTIFRDLCQQDDFPTASFIEGVGTALASRTLEQHFQKDRRREKQEQSLSKEKLRQVIDYIEEHMRENITVEDLAGHLGMSVRQFRRLFSRAAGVPPLQFILRQRVQKALELLRSGKFRVAEAAYEVGFYDQSHFDRHCQKFFGFPPKEAVMAESS